MRLSIPILTSILLATKALAGCSYENGNYYCNEVTNVLYSNVGYSGTYQDVTNMDESSCECTQESVSFSGTNSPLDEELSVHFRGPIKLLQFAAYYPSSSVSKRDLSKRDLNKRDEDCTSTRHIHHQHKRAAEPATEIVEITQTVYVNGEGSTVKPTTSTSSTSTSTSTSSTSTSSTTVLTGTSTSSTSTSTSTGTVATTEATTTSSKAADATSSTSTSSSASSTSTSDSSSSDWTRTSYYTPGTADNVVFLNTLGGVTDSGTWSSCFGNSLSYAAANGVDASSSSQILNEVTLASDDEFMIFTGESCSSTSSQDSECGYYRSDIPAYHGFAGSQKILLFEFTMPTDSSSSGASNPDMPAIWLLNAKIPRTLQYGDSSCSCWSTGCGELDLFEILSEGDDRLISHIHDGQGNDGTSTGGGGSQDYFARPTSGSFKGAVIFNSDKTIQIAQIDDDFDFSTGISSDQVATWNAMSGGTAALS